MKSSSMVKTLSLIVAVLMVAMTAGCQYILPKEEESLAPPLVAPKDVVYTTVKVEKGDIVNSVQGVARFESVRMVDVSFTAGGGRVKTINIKYGDEVKKGDVLVELDTGDLDYQLQVAKLRLEQLENNYDVIKKRVRDKTQRRNAEIDLEVARLGVKQLEKQKADARLVSPIDGNIVYVTTATLGSPVDAYSTLVRIADPSVKMLEYEDDANRGSFQIGAKVQVTLNEGGAACEGEVVSTPFERSQFDSEDLAKKLFIKVPDEFLKDIQVGDEAKVVLTIAKREGALVLPRNVVKTYLQRRYVQVLEGNVKVEKDVQVGLETSTQCEILSGLNEGDKVIVR